MSRKGDENSPYEDMKTKLDFIEECLRSGTSRNSKDQSAEGSEYFENEMQLSIRQQTTNTIDDLGASSRVNIACMPSSLDNASKDTLASLSSSAERLAFLDMDMGNASRQSSQFISSASSKQKNSTDFAVHVPKEYFDNFLASIHSYDSSLIDKINTADGAEDMASLNNILAQTEGSRELQKLSGLIKVPEATASSAERVEFPSTLSSCPTDDPQSQENTSNIPKSSSFKNLLIVAADGPSQKPMNEKHEKAKATGSISKRTVANSSKRRCSDKQLHKTCTIPSCNKVVKMPHDFSAHAVRLHKDGPYGCSWPTCEKRFLTSTTIVPHLLTHSGETPFGCNFPDCDDKFKDMKELIYHMRSHTGEKPFFCDICHTKVATREELTLHREAHIGAKLQE